MTDDQAVPLPDDAIALAIGALARRYPKAELPPEKPGVAFPFSDFLDMLEAAAPALYRQERERIRQLAIDSDAIYMQCESPDCGDRDHSDPFADLLEGDSDG